MANQPNREDQRPSRNMERRHQEDIDAMARKNAETQREAQKVRKASDERKIAMRRKADQH